MSKSPLNLWVFRDGKRRVPGEQLRSALSLAITAAHAGSSEEPALSALLRAGELECAVADEDVAAVAPFEQLTDALAETVLQGHPQADFGPVRSAALRAPAPAEVTISTPEGFAYYALHPLAYSEVLDQLPDLPSRVLVIGIRSVGATMSAVTAAAARKRGMQATRMTVRPMGHPYDREVKFSPRQQTEVRAATLAGAEFLIVDEGPGLSGSSFLSVAEELERAGADRGKIRLICGGQVTPDTLCARNAAARWRRFRWVSVGPQRPRVLDSAHFIGGGAWRGHSYPDEELWPASWTSMERSKYLVSADRGARLWKFGGLGHYGDRVFAIEEQLADAGFSARPTSEEGGYFSYSRLSGRPMQARDLSAGVIQRLAEYCAFRQKCFPAELRDLAQLQSMVEHNLIQCGMEISVNMQLRRPVIADSRMQPHEWILTDSGEMLKTDAGSHGDDHFFPGPTDIAWDLAGAIVEWRMSPVQAAEFLEV